MDHPKILKLEKRLATEKHNREVSKWQRERPILKEICKGRKIDDFVFGIVTGQI